MSFTVPRICNRCGGNVYDEETADGEVDEVCINCGNRRLPVRSRLYNVLVPPARLPNGELTAFELYLQRSRASG